MIDAAPRADWAHPPACRWAHPPACRWQRTHGRRHREAGHQAHRYRRGVLCLNPADVVSRLMTGNLPKGEALGTARIAGILAAKRTPDLIPLCHPLPLSRIKIHFEPLGDRIRVVASVTTRGRDRGRDGSSERGERRSAHLVRHDKGSRSPRIDHRDPSVLKSGGKSGDWSVS